MNNERLTLAQVIWLAAYATGMASGQILFKLAALRLESTGTASEWLIALARKPPGKITYASAGVGSGSHVSTELLARDPRYWALVPGEAWHGFQSLEAGFAITDPAKLTLLTPGFDRLTGDYEAHGVPAPVVMLT